MVEEIGDYYKEKLINRDEEFFKENDFSQFIKDDKNKTFIYILLNLIKKRYLERTKAEQNEIWKFVQNMLKCCIEFKQLELELDNN